MNDTAPLFETVLAKIDYRELFFQFLDNDLENYAYIKSAEGKFIWINNTLRMVIGATDTYIGTSDADYFSEDLTSRYREEDDRVMKSRQPVHNQPWIVPDHEGRIHWYLSSKFPLINPKTDELIGIAGLMQSYTSLSENIQPSHEMQKVVAYILKSYPNRILVEELANLIFLSVNQFERQFRRLFHMSPTDFILKVRLDAAMRLLSEGDLSVTQIAQKTGFYDNSAFTRQFRKVTGYTPLEFRKKYFHFIKLTTRKTT